MSASPKALVILLHGVGSNGADMMQLASAWKASLPDVVFVAPDAPTRSGLGGGYEWFSIAGVTPVNRAARIAAARAAFDATIRHELELGGFSNRLDRVVLIGFSQGSMMLLDAVASGRWPVAAGVAFSGRLAGLPPLTPSLGTRLLLIHGDADPIVPVAETVAATAALRDLGMSVESVIEPRLGHTISMDGAKRAEMFILTVVAG